MELGMWSLVVALFGAVALAAALGFWYDLTHRPTRAHFLTMTTADTARGRNMSHYYAIIHGTEWEARPAALRRGPGAEPARGS